MSAVRRFVAFYRNDWRMLRRTPTLVYSVVMTIALLLLVRYFRGQIPENLYFGPAVFTLLMIPMVMGMSAAFIMVNEIEEKTIQALQVVPISTAGFLCYRLLWSVLMTALLGLAAPAILGLGIGAQGTLALVFLLVLEAVVFALVVVDFSKTRMQAMTVMKVVGWILLLPVVVKFLVVARNWAEGWTRLTLFLPTHWVYKLYEGLPSGDYSSLPAALLVHILWMAALFVFFRRRVL